MQTLKVIETLIKNNFDFFKGLIYAFLLKYNRTNTRKEHRVKQKQQLKDLHTKNVLTTTP